MNFSLTKKDGFTKKIVVRAFEANHGNKSDLAKQIFSSANFSKNKIHVISPNKHIKIREISKAAGASYIYFSIYNPKESVSTTPLTAGKKDLVDVENYDNLHVFVKVQKNTISAIFQISTNWPEVKLALLFKSFGINITPTTVLDKKIVDTLRNEGFRSLHVNIDVHPGDFKKQPSYIASILRNEPKVGQMAISGHLEINAKENVTIATSIEKHPSKWIKDLDSDFYIETKKGSKITGDDIKLNRTYFATPYGSKTIVHQNAEEILDYFIANAL